MTKKDLMEAAMKGVCCRKEAVLAVERILSAMREALQRREPVHLTGIGTLYARLEKPRPGRRFDTGEKIAVPGRVVVRFRPSSKGRFPLPGGLSAAA